MIAQREPRSDSSLFPQTELPATRQYRHCGLLRHSGDDFETGQDRSIGARSFSQQLVVDLKHSFACGPSANFDLTTTKLGEGWRKKSISNASRRTNTAFEKRNSRTCVRAAVPDPAVGLCMKLAK